MPTLPFDWTPEATPSGHRSRKPGGTAAGTEAISVSALSKQIVGALETLPTSLRVKGELSNLKRSRNGHWYFSLKDEAALIDCAMWSSRVRGLTCEPRDGDAVEVVGHVEHYAKQGRTQLIVERLQPQGQGTLQARFEALCAELRLLGWFEHDCKQPLPVLPRCIAVLTAGGSAALADVQRTSVDRCPSVQLLLATGNDLAVHAALQGVVHVGVWVCFAGLWGLIMALVLALGVYLPMWEMASAARG